MTFCLTSLITSSQHCSRRLLAACCPCDEWAHSRLTLYLQDFTACHSTCRLHVQTPGYDTMRYDFSSMSNVTSVLSRPRFTNKGVQFFQHFNFDLCGKEVREGALALHLWCKEALKSMLPVSVSSFQGRMSATCVDNVTDSGREVKGYVCQSTVVPSGIRSQNMVSTQPFVIGDALIGRRYHLSPCHVISLKKKQTQRCFISSH